MKEKPLKEIIGTTVVGQHGREIGIVKGAQVDTDSWCVVSLRLKPDKGVREELKLRRSILGGSTLSLPVDQISGISDVLVLKVPLSEVRFDEADEEVADPGSEEADGETP